MKRTLLLFLLSLSASFAFSQRFINGIGITVFSTGGAGFNSFITGGLTYSPRVNISESDNSAISIGLPLSIGLSYSGSSSGNASASAMVNLPLVVNYNFGAGATKEVEDKFGFFAGGGLGYHVAAYANDNSDYTGNNGDGTTTVRSYGPVANAGIRIGVGQRSHNIE
ncbi:MAG: hypothetical protein JST96_08075, partial [Bacteroidetes bacterium]|nr:hypothetical protein [Bacteroidota bacterium]